MFKYKGKVIDISLDLVVEVTLHRTEGEGEDAVEVPYTETFIEPAANLQNPERRAELGIEEEPDISRPDDTYHIVIGRADGGYDQLPKPVDEVAGTKLRAVNGHCDVLLASVKAGYPQGEVESWSKQENEARAWLANNAASTPLLNGLCSGRGLNKSDLVVRVIAKADAYAVFVGLVIGVRQAYEDRIGELVAAHDFDGLVAVDPMQGWPTL